LWDWDLGADAGLAVDLRPAAAAAVVAVEAQRAAACDIRAGFTCVVAWARSERAGGETFRKNKHRDADVAYDPVNALKADLALWGSLKPKLMDY
jgi:hypothetical protein